MRGRFIYVICFFSLLSIFTSCVISKNIVKKGSLCGVVVDENNKPIPDFLIYCFKNEAYKQSSITNESGIFVFPDIDIGSYYIKGEKINYSKFEKQEYNFNNCSDLLCIQIKSLDECIKNINAFIKVGEFQKGVNLLNSIDVKEDSLSYAVWLCYQSYLNYKIGNNKKYADYIKKLKKIKNEKCDLFIKTMEENIYE